MGPGTEEVAADRIGTPLLVALGLLSAASPLAMDFYLASLPAAQASLRTSPTGTQLTITAFLVGLGVGQLVWGPVSDRYGRRRPLLVGCTVSVLAAPAAVLAPSIGVLVAARLVQALAASAGAVMSRAVIADRLRGPAAARSMSLMMTVNSVAPVVAPLVGGLLAGADVSWRGVLAVVLAAMVAQALAALMLVRESLPPQRRSDAVRFAHIPRLLTRGEFLGYALTSMCAFGALMAYISSSSFVYQRVIGTSSAVYGVGFAVNATGMIAGGLASARLVRRGVRPASVVGVAVPVMVGASAAVLGIAIGPLPKGLLAIAFLILQTAMGFVMGNCAALAIGGAREIAGSASGVLGSLNFLFGGLVSSFAGLAGGGTAVPLGVVATLSSTAALGAFALARARPRHAGHA